jgi:hypothetical protein
VDSLEKIDIRKPKLILPSFQILPPKLASAKVGCGWLAPEGMQEMPLKGIH